MRVQLNLGRSHSLSGGSWRLNPFWVQLIDVSLMSEIQEFFRINGPLSSHATVWETMKAVIRGLYIREISKRKSKSQELTVALQQRVSDTESHYITDPTDSARLK